MIKKLIAIIATATLAVAATAPASAFTVLPGDSVIMMVAEEASVGNESNLGYWNKGANKDQPGMAILQCTGTKDPSCNFDDPETDFDTRSVFGPCLTANDVACVESLELAVAGSPLVAAKFIREATGGQKLAADPAVNFLASGSPSIFESESVPNAGGTKTYAVVLKGRQGLNKKTGKWFLDNLTAVVIPYVDAKDPKYGVKAADGNGAGNTNTCAYYESGVCGKAVDFVEGTQVKVSFRAPKTVGGWFRGRVKAPNIAVSSANALSNKISVSGESVVVPRLQYPMTAEQLSQPGNEWLTKISNWGAEGMNAAGFGGNEPNVFKFIDHFRPLLKDTATGTNTYWDITSTRGGQGSRCLSDTSKVLGIVTTNAMGYDGSSPTFKNGFLDYKVAGLHYESDGKTLVEGSYDLVMRSETARCLYGFSNAPLSATVSVTGGAAKNVATTVVSEKNGWLKMAAYGFTFSNKTIKVKITKKAVKKVVKKK